MKILVNVRIPAISENYDVLIPDDLRINDVISLISSAVESLSNHLYVASGEECLCSVEQNTLLSQEAALNAYKIQNGDHLIMM